MELESQLNKHASEQHGAVEVEAAKALGATPRQLHTLRHCGRWTTPSPRVLVSASAPRTNEQRIMAAVLDATSGAVASHDTAAALWRIPGFPFEVPHVSRNRLIRHPSSKLAVLHLPSRLDAADCTVREGIPVTTVPRTVFDLAASVSERRLSRIVDTVATQSPGTVVRLHQLVEELGNNGRDGVASMRRVLESRPPGYQPPESGLERRFMDVLHEAGERPLRRQVNVGGDDWIGRVDFLDDPPLLVVEVDSARFHSSPTDRENDRRRDDALRAAGFLEIVRVHDEEIWYQPDRAVQKVRAGRAAVRRHLASDQCALRTDLT